MTWRRILALAGLAWTGMALAGESKRGNPAMLAELTTGKYRIGQIWKFTPRPGEDDATLTVVRVETSKDAGVIVHVSVKGVHVKNPRAPEGFNDSLQHLPFSEEAISKSVTILVGKTKDLPAYEEGYREWRKAWDAGKAGAFAVTVAETIGLLESTLNSPLPGERVIVKDR